ncbi:MAG: 4-amino-4-deoxychorismate lyase [Bacteroidia bacterium]|nr:MAG: 4-amino-4-deoxychorismate lyase [Bacteroidia bacterium]
MCLLESIRIEQGEVQLLHYHQRRMDASAQALWHTAAPSLQHCVEAMSLPAQGVYKWRLTYNDKGIQTSELMPYQPKSIHSLQLAQADALEYGFKYADRSAIMHLWGQRGVCDDILISKQGYITDSSYCNVVLRHVSGVWHTPNTCLLKGVMRQYLIDTNTIAEVNIKISDLVKYTKVRLVNAMMPWRRCIEMDINAIKKPHKSIGVL